MFNTLLFGETYDDAASPAFEVMMLAPWVVAMRIPNLLYEVATPWHATGGRRGGEGEKAVVEKTAVEIESPTEDDILTLYTCTPLWSSSKRLVVQAVPVI